MMKKTTINTQAILKKPIKVGDIIKLVPGKGYSCSCLLIVSSNEDNNIHCYPKLVIPKNHYPIDCRSDGRVCSYATLHCLPRDREFILLNEEEDIAKIMYYKMTNDDGVFND